jgi:threonine dehydrogenase-like Zn-dependent dehydrogenase
LPPADSDSVSLRTLASGISRGTEVLVFAGHVPDSQYETMRAPMMDGAFPFPVKYGYSAVAETPDGARVFLLHPHQDRIVAKAAQCIAVPDAVPTARAMLVVGAGVVGLLTASLLARSPGARVTVADANARRAPLARHFGCDFVLPEAAPSEQELIVHASGTEAGLRCALQAAAFEARIVEASWFGTTSPALPLGEAFHQRRIRLLSSQVGSVATAMRGRRSHPERLALALDLLADSAFDDLLEGPTRFEDMPDAMPRILAPGGLCHVITYGTD